MVELSERVFNELKDRIEDLEAKLKYVRRIADTKQLVISKQSSLIDELRRENHDLRNDRLSRLQLQDISLVSGDGQKIIYDLINHLIENEGEEW